MEGYTFERFWKELDDGFQLYYIYMNRKYLLAKLRRNCYSVELIDIQEKGALPKKQIITLKSLQELFPYIENIEYKV